MAFIGNTNTTQAFTPAIDYFSGTGSATAFTLSRPVASVAQVQVTIDNVAQNPSSAYTVSGSTITFTSAPLSGTNNIYVYYTSPITQVDCPGSEGTVGTTQLQNGLTVNFANGSAAAPSITNDGDTNTGIFFPAADTIAFSEGGAEAMRIDSSGNVGIGTSSPSYKLDVRSSLAVLDGSANIGFWANGTTYTQVWQTFQSPNDLLIKTTAAKYIAFLPNNAEAMRIDSSGNLLVGRTTGLGGGEIITAQTGGSAGIGVNRQNDDGNLVNFYQAGTNEGNISVSGTTVSYNGGHLSRWAQTITAKDESLVKGTVLSNLDEMNVYTDSEGNSVQNEQLNKVKVSDVEGDANVAGVFVNWSYDEQHSIDEINMAMTGDMIIRIAQGVTVVRGDLLMSAGDGTAKPQGDDIIRSKTVAKVTSKPRYLHIRRWLILCALRFNGLLIFKGN